jgi:hypothetical protein
MHVNGKEPKDGEIVRSVDANEATESLHDAGKFAIASLQGAAQMAQHIAGATVFMITILPVADEPGKARMLSFSVGCECPVCVERASAISEKLLADTRDISAQYTQRVSLAHNEQIEEKPQ